MGSLAKSQIDKLRKEAHFKNLHPKETARLEEFTEKVYKVLPQFVSQEPVNVFPADPKRRQNLFNDIFNEIMKIAFNIFISDGKFNFNVWNPVKVLSLGWSVIKIILRIRKYNNGQ
jgi:hypothetical protein